MKGQQAHMYQNLLNARRIWVWRVSTRRGLKYVRYPGHERAHKGVPAHAGKLLLHICLPSIALFGLTLFPSFFFAPAIHSWNHYIWPRKVYIAIKIKQFRQLEQ